MVLIQEHTVSNLLWLYAESTLLFLVIGLGIGSYVPSIGSMSYLKFFLIGFLFANVLRVVFMGLGIGLFKKINSKKYINQMSLLPFKYEDIIRGELIWGTARGFVGSIILILLGLFMGLFDLNKLLITIMLVLVGSYLFSTMSLAICLLSRNSKSINAWQFLFIMPMYFLSGAFFPIEELPRYLYYIAMTLPLTHMIILSRTILEGTMPSTAILSAAVLLIYSFLFSFIIAKLLSIRPKVLSRS